ncbi:hypothetical protein HAV15_001156 [Penicillium sp. str. |nr:hypothetical protein HAV15_001156 [Penicillium sp. str. \
MFYLDPPVRLDAQPFTSLPDKWAVPGTSAAARAKEWANNILAGKAVSSLLEGPCFDSAGNLYVVDIPFGRIFRIAPDGSWSLFASYYGWPNGLKVTSDGRILVADHRQGLVEITEIGKAVGDGWVYFTDQGQSGLQEPSGYVYRYHRISKIVERVLSNIPSPNGFVLTTDATRLAPFVLDGGVSKVGVFLNLSGGGGPGGLAVDVEGGLIVAQPGFHLVLRLPTPEARIVGVHGIRENKHRSARNVGEIGTIVVGGGRIVEQALLRHEPTDCCR